ncbi:hypothetical protein ACFLWR_03375 [Chloroflexota bacterium]
MVRTPEALFFMNAPVLQRLSLTKYHREMATKATTGASHMPAVRRVNLVSVIPTASLSLIKAHQQKPPAANINNEPTQVIGL